MVDRECWSDVEVYHLQRNEVRLGVYSGGSLADGGASVLDIVLALYLGGVWRSLVANLCEYYSIFTYLQSKYLTMITHLPRLLRSNPMNLISKEDYRVQYQSIVIY